MLQLHLVTIVTLYSPFLQRAHVTAPPCNICDCCIHRPCKQHMLQVHLVKFVTAAFTVPANSKLQLHLVTFVTAVFTIPANSTCYSSTLLTLVYTFPTQCTHLSITLFTPSVNVINNEEYKLYKSDNYIINVAQANISTQQVQPHHTSHIYAT